MSCRRCPSSGGLCPQCHALLLRAEGEAFLRMTETQLQRQVREIAKKLGHWQVYHTYCSKRSEPGFPDLVLVRRETETHSGRLIFSELKREGESPTIPQQTWIEALGTSVAGVEVYVWRPLDLENIVEILLRK